MHTHHHHHHCRHYFIVLSYGTTLAIANEQARSNVFFLSLSLFRFLLLVCLYVWNLIYYVVVILAVEWEKWDGAEEKAEKKSDVYVIDKKNCVLNNKSSSVVEKQEKKIPNWPIRMRNDKLPTNQAIKDVPMFLFFSSFFFSSSSSSPFILYYSRSCCVSSSSLPLD